MPRAATSTLCLRDPGVDPAVQQPGKHVRAEPALPLLPGGELGEFESPADGDVLEQDRAWQLTANGLDDERRGMIARYRDRDRADLAGRGIGQAQPLQLPDSSDALVVEEA